jgi:signal transduction histidine kinase
LNVLIDELIKEYILFYDSEFEFQNRLNVILFVLLFGIVLVLVYVYLLERNYKKRLFALNRTLQQKIEKEVKKRQKKEKMLMNQSKIKAMSELIVSIAHNWRQPINAVGFIVQDIKDAYEHKELDDAYLNQSVDKVMEVLNDLSTMINDFSFLFSKDVKKEDFDLIELLSNLQNMLELQNIEYILHRDKKQSYVIYGLKNELQQVFLYIVKNSIEAIEKRKENEDFKAVIEVDIQKINNNVKITFSDNGIGIDEAIKDRIFEPYFTTKTQGVGLGLYVVKTIIENHMNGHVEFYQLNNKTVFEVLLKGVG